MSKMKKNIASHLLDSVAGRKAATSFIGPEGNAILDGIKSFMAKDLGHEEAKERKKDLLKLASKIHIMITEKKLTEENTQSVVKPLVTLGWHWLQYLSYDEKKSAEELKRLAVSMKASMTECHALLIALLSPHMQDKNAAKITSLFEYANNDAFLDKIRFDAKFDEERKIVVQNLDLVFQTLPGPLLSAIADQEMPCNVTGCEKPRLKADGKFQGSELCGVHHFKKYTLQIETPRFEFWLKEESLRTRMLDWLGKENKLEVAHFIGEVEKFKGIARKEMRAVRGPVLYQKFVETKIVTADEKVIGELKRAVESKEGVSATCFDELLAQVSEDMQRLFMERFTVSKTFADWKEQVTLPPEVERAVRDASARAHKARQESLKQNKEQQRKEMAEALSRIHSASAAEAEGPA